MRIGFDGKRAVQNFTGLGNYSRYLIETLYRYFPDNDYLLYAPKEQSSDQFEAFVRKCPNIKCIYPDKLFYKLGSLWRSKMIIGQLCADGLDIFHGLSNELPMNIDKIHPAKSVVTIHDLIFRIYPQYYPVIDRHIYSYKFRKACEESDAIVAVSSCTKRDIVRLYNIPPEKIHVIYQGCNDAFSSETSQESKERVRRIYGLPERYVLNVGSIENRKNILLVIKAMETLPKDIHLVIVGKRTRYADLIEDYVKDHGMERQIHICSNVSFDDLPSVFQQAEIFVYPSIYEGFGIPVIEALHSGIPVIAATGSCLEEAGGESSIYVSPYDVQDMADNIIRLWNDPDLRKNMAERGKEYVTRFSASRQAAQLMDLYRSLIEKS